MLRRRTRRRLYVFLTVLAIFLTACSSGASDDADAEAPTEGTASPDDGGETETEAEAPGDGPTHGGTMVVAIGADPAHLNRGFQTGPEIGVVALTMQESLIRLTSDLEVVPSLAESWDINDDGTEIVFHLREGVTWHDGEPFTSADVIYTLQEVTPLHPSGPTIVDQIASLEAPDEHTVVVTLNEPSAIFLSSLLPDNVPILPAHIFEGTDVVTNPANLEPVGTGPFQFSEWAPGERIVVTRNENYWDGDKPYLDQIVFQIIPDGTSRLNATLAGEVDYIPRALLDPTAIEALDAEEGTTVSSGAGSASMRPLYFNHEREPLGDAEVRKALIQAIDRNAMVANIFDGRAEVGRTSLPHNFESFWNPAVDFEEMYPFDLEAAAAKLDELGYEPGSDGIRFSLDYLFTDEYFGTREIGEIIRANFAEIGVEVNLEQREVEVYGNTVFPERDFDLASNILGSRTDPSLGVDRIFKCEDDREVRFTNPSGYCNQELDAVFAEANLAIDLEERRELYHRTQEIIAEDMPNMILLSVHNIDALSDRFGGGDAFFDAGGGSVDQDWKQLWVRQ